MKITTVCVLFLAPVAAIAQALPAAEVGFHYAYNSVGVSNENGAAVYGEYFFKGSSAHLHQLANQLAAACVAAVSFKSRTMYWIACVQAESLSPLKSYDFRPTIWPVDTS